MNIIQLKDCAQASFFLVIPATVCAVIPDYMLTCWACAGKPTPASASAKLQLHRRQPRRERQGRGPSLTNSANIDTSYLL